jgi:hypothetical protein
MNENILHAILTWNETSLVKDIYLNSTASP